jgi:hypothetical protein
MVKEHRAFEDAARSVPAASCDELDLIWFLSLELSGGCTGERVFWTTTLLMFTRDDGIRLLIDV